MNFSNRKQNLFFFLRFSYKRETDRASEQGVGREKSKQTPGSEGAQHGAESHHPENMTPAETKS